AIVAPIAGRLTSRIGSRLPIVAGLCIAAVGLALLMPADEHSRYPSLLAPFLLWGIGLGILTPALVSAAIAAVPASRSGLASAINNTARQTGGAIGIAVAGAVTGPPANQQSFVNGFHAVALGAAILYLITAALAFALVPGKV